MEKVIKKLFLSGYLVAAAAISLTALSSSSASAATQDQKTSQFSVTVPSTLTLSSLSFTSDTAGEGTTLKASPTQIKTGTLSATVKSTAGFTISLHAATPALTASGVGTIPASSSVTSGTSGWGIKKKPTANTPGTNASTYTAMTTSAVEFYRQTNTQITAQAYSFVVGVASSSVQAQGTYSTAVTVTAVNI